MYARCFAEIESALANNADVRDRFVKLAATDGVCGKVLEGDGRVRRFRDALVEFGYGRLSLDGLVVRYERELSSGTSPHWADKRVFSSGWAVRLARTQVSRFYNQAVLELVLEAGGSRVAVEHSADEADDSRCTRELAGGEHDASELLRRLVSAYRDGQHNGSAVKIPDHPHCTHTVRPVAD